MRKEQADFVFSTAATCAFFDISRDTLGDWARKGAPKLARGKWDIKAVMEWRYGGGQTESPEARKLKADADIKEAKAAQEKIKLNVTQGLFIPVETVQAELARVFANLKKSLLALGHNCAASLASLDMDAAELAKQEIDKRVNDALLELSEGGNYRARPKKKAR